MFRESYNGFLDHAQYELIPNKRKIPRLETSEQHNLPIPPTAKLVVINKLDYMQGSDLADRGLDGMYSAIIQKNMETRWQLKLSSATNRGCACVVELELSLEDRFTKCHPYSNLSSENPSCPVMRWSEHCIWHWVVEFSHQRRCIEQCLGVCDMYLCVCVMVSITNLTVFKIT